MQKKRFMQFYDHYLVTESKMVYDKLKYYNQIFTYAYTYNACYHKCDDFAAYLRIELSYKGDGTLNMILYIYLGMTTIKAISLKAAYK